jgi:hypothetical protein
MLGRRPFRLRRRHRRHRFHALRRASEASCNVPQRLGDHAYKTVDIGRKPLLTGLHLTIQIPALAR